jgi:hypothetical protein
LTRGREQSRLKKLLISDKLFACSGDKRKKSDWDKKAIDVCLAFRLFRGQREENKAG